MLKIRETWACRTKASYVGNESVAVKEARSLNELPLGASDTQLTDQ